MNRYRARPRRTGLEAPAARMRHTASAMSGCKATIVSVMGQGMCGIMSCLQDALKVYLHILPRPRKGTAAVPGLVGLATEAEPAASGPDRRLGSRPELPRQGGIIRQRVAGRLAALVVIA